MCSTAKFRQELLSEGRIALHYSDNLNYNDPHDFPNKSGFHAIKRLQSYCQCGAYVAAEFDEGWLIGKIASGSKIELLEASCGGEKHGVEYSAGARIHSYKTVKLQEFKVLNNPLGLISARPRQGSVCEWGAVGDRVARLIEDGKLPCELDALSTAEQEVLCYEWLKTHGKIQRLLLPIGRTLKDVDVFGINPVGGKVLAQVTFNPSRAECEEKMTRLSCYDAQEKYFFLATKDNVQIQKNAAELGLIFVDMRNAFAQIYDDEKNGGKQMIESWLRVF
jgi:hypothetical protein